MESISISLDSWMIQDGNYDDFAVGQEVIFALEFYPGELTRTVRREKAIIAIGPYEYQVVAEVIYRSEETWIADFGLMAYQELKNPKYEKGDWLEGTINIGVDPFFYSEYLKDESGIPWIKYK